MKQYLSSKKTAMLLSIAWVGEAVIFFIKAFLNMHWETKVLWDEPKITESYFVGGDGLSFFIGAILLSFGITSLLYSLLKMKTWT